MVTTRFCNTFSFLSQNIVTLTFFSRSVHVQWIVHNFIITVKYPVMVALKHTIRLFVARFFAVQQPCQFDGGDAQSKKTLYHYYRLQRSCGKVIFSQACVKNSVHRGQGGVYLSACWDTPPRQTPPARHPPGQAPPRQTHPPGRQPPLADTPPTVTAADGTHPTVMLSGYSDSSSQLLFNILTCHSKGFYICIIGPT